MIKPILPYVKHPTCLRITIRCMMLPFIFVFILAGSPEWGAFCNIDKMIYPGCFRIMNLLQIFLYIICTYLKCINFGIDESKAPEEMRMPKTFKNGKPMRPILHTMKIMIPCKKCKDTGPFTFLEFHRSQTYMWQLFYGI